MIQSARLLLKEGRAEEALGLLEKGKRSATLLANKALCYEQLGRLDDAVAAAQEAVQMDEHREDIAEVLNQLRASQLMERGVACAERNDFFGALEAFEEAGEVGADGSWRYNVAVIKNKMGHTEEALEMLLASEKQEGILPLLGELLCKRQRWTEAVEVIDEAIGLGLELPASLLYNYGVAALKSGDNFKARQAFDDVISYYPNYGLAYDALSSMDAQDGATLCQKGKFDEAIPKLYAATKRTAKNSTIYNLALALLKTRRAPEAKEQFQQLLKTDHKNAQAGLDAANLMIEGGNYIEKEDMELLSAAPKKRIYQIAYEKGVGALAGQDDMVMLLSGIEEWVASTLKPLEDRVAALESGTVGPASEDRALIQMLFDRVASLEERGKPLEDDVSSFEAPSLDLNGKFDLATLSRNVGRVQSTADLLDRRLRAVEGLVVGGPQRRRKSHRFSAGDSLLAEEEEEDEVIGDATNMSVVARLAVQEERFKKMSSKLEAQAKEIERLKATIEEGGLYQATHPLIRKKPPAETGANIGKMDMPNFMDELKAATGRRAAQRKHIGLALQD